MPFGLLPKNHLVYIIYNIYRERERVVISTLQPIRYPVENHFNYNGDFCDTKRGRIQRDAQSHEQTIGKSHSCPIEHTHKPKTSSGSTKGVMLHQKSQQSFHQSYSTLSLGADKPSGFFCACFFLIFFWGRFGEKLLGQTCHRRKHWYFLLCRGLCFNLG